jgi:hypothetical protein
MAFADLIPVEFFTPPPVPVDPRNGRVSLIAAGLRYAGSILVGWEQRCPAFSKNLEGARRLKAAGHGTYRPEAGGWVFNASAVEAVLKEFAGLVIDDLVLDLFANPPPPPRPLHGTITAEKDGYLVCWGNGYNVPSNAFKEYLDHARKIRTEIGGRGFDSVRKGWKLARAAAGAIVHYFPAENFDHPAQLLEDAARFPFAKEDAVKVAQEQAAFAGPDPLAEKLIAAAELILAQY